MGPLRSSKKRPQANRTHHCVKEISFVASAQRLRAVELRCPQRSEPPEQKATPLRTADTTAYALQRMIWLVSSAFPRVRNRTMTAMMISATIPIPTYNGLIKLISPGFSGVGVGDGEAAAAGDAFLLASIDCAYCKR